MKKKIGIIGSTGSIGSCLLNVINKSDFDIIFLSAKNNYKKLFKQAQIFNVKNLIITHSDSYQKAIKINKNKKIRLFNNFDFNKIIKKKLDYVMSSISGLEGLRPTFDIIKHTKKLQLQIKNQLFVLGQF